MSDIIEHKIKGLLKSQEFDQAFVLMMEYFQERVYWHVRRMVLNHEDANDITQNVFIKSWKALPSFKGESKVYTWLYRIASNESITFLNSKKMKFIEGAEEQFQIMQSSLQSDEYFTGDEIQAKLQSAVASLPPKQQAIFNMKYFEDLKYTEIAEILDQSVGGLKASYHHAVKKIEEFLKND